MARVMIDSALLDAVIAALNTAPRFKLKGRYRDSYAMVGELERLQGLLRQHSVTILFGEEPLGFDDIVDYRDDKPVLSEGYTRQEAIDGMVRGTATFDTAEELTAYLSGIDEAVGWLECEVLSDEQAADLRTVLGETE